jgi:hypothetical protein
VTEHLVHKGPGDPKKGATQLFNCSKVHVVIAVEEEMNRALTHGWINDLHHRLREGVEGLLRHVLSSTKEKEGIHKDLAISQSDLLARVS